MSSTARYAVKAIYCPELSGIRRIVSVWNETTYINLACNSTANIILVIYKRGDFGLELP